MQRPKVKLKDIHEVQRFPKPYPKPVSCAWDPHEGSLTLADSWCTSEGTRYQVRSVWCSRRDLGSRLGALGSEPSSITTCRGIGKSISLSGSQFYQLSMGELILKVHRPFWKSEEIYENCLQDYVRTLTFCTCLQRVPGPFNACLRMMG